MAASNTIARYEADTIRDGIAWLIVWKTGRSWHAESGYLCPICRGKQRKGANT